MYSTADETGVAVGSAEATYASHHEPFNSTPVGVQSDFVRLSARTPHVGPQHVR